MTLIHIEDLTKHFKILNRREGLSGACLDLFSGDYRTVEAISGISFGVDAGETVGYIGPNGAGKSTTIKMMSRSVLFMLCLIMSNCASPAPAIVTPVAMNTAISTATSTPEPPSLGAGFRFSTYGIRGNPGPEYFVSVGKQMSARFPASHPEAIWIVGEFFGGGKTYLSFHAETDDANIVSGYVDMNEQTLDPFDKNRFKVWLQVEPANADMIILIDSS